MGTAKKLDPLYIIQYSLDQWYFFLGVSYETVNRLYDFELLPSPPLFAVSFTETLFRRRGGGRRVIAHDSSKKKILSFNINHRGKFKIFFTFKISPLHFYNSSGGGWWWCCCSSREYSVIHRGPNYLSCDLETLPIFLSLSSRDKIINQKGGRGSKSHDSVKVLILYKSFNIIWVIRIFIFSCVSGS